MEKVSKILCVFVLAMLVASLRPTNAEADIFRNASDLQESPTFGLSSPFDSVGLLVGTNANGDSFYSGSGVLIDPFWVLTAGHTLHDSSNTSWSSMRFSNSPDVLNNLGTLMDADLFLSHETYIPGTTAGQGHDIGLIRLATPIYDVNSANRFYGQDVIGSEMIMGGYGRPGVHGQPLGDRDGIRRGGRNIGDSFGRSFGVTTVADNYWVSDLDRFASDNPLALEWQSSVGASGGGWFIDINGDWQLAGITNGGLDGDRFSFSLRTSLYNDWIDDTMAANSAVPEPSSFFLLLVGAGIAGARRRRRIS